MVKAFLFAAAVANFFLIVSSSAKVHSHASSSASSSSGYASSSSHGKSFAIATTSGHSQYYPPPPCDTSPTAKPRRIKRRPKCYNKYEVFSNCPVTVCRPKTCDEVGFPVACVDLNRNGTCPVPPECICVEDYVRNHKRICIPMKDCPSCGGDCNAEPGCNSNCNRLCSKLNDDPVPCTADCVYNSCECKKGFVFDEIQDKCVHPSHCTCKSNEVYTDCVQAQCGPKTCAQLRSPVHCLKIDPKYCKKGCICKKGYVRNKYGECIPKDQCPPICGPHEFPSNCMQADCAPQNCTQLGFPIVCVRVDQKHCKKGCLCKEGYARNSDGVCIPVKECPSCGGDPNAESAECASNCGRLCSNYNRTDVVCTLECAINGCQCKKGYVLDSRTNRCVLPCDCTPTCGKHEVFSTCTQADCAPKYCKQLGFPIACPRVDPKYCRKGCLCKPGYVRNSAGVCIPVKKCPSCGGDPNAEGGECASNCGRLCSNYNRTDVVCTLECAINDCQCKKGYVLDSNTNRCVLPCDCTPTCGKHEVFSTCTQADCAPKYCKQLGFPIACPRVDPKYCKKGCLCKPGYVRNSAGVCIPVKKCPSCGGDPNAEGGECASNCGRLCSNYNRTDVVCTLECAINDCQCKKGYVLDSKTNRCVLPCDCTPTCGKHEVFSTCTQADCAPKYCKQLGFPIACPRVDPKYCKKGCLCKPGYVRNSAGVCIPVKKCPSCGGDPNAEGGECASNCGRLCSNYNRTDVVCTLECAINGCQCKKGYVFDTKTNRCVLPCDCTPVCKKNEVYSECINGGCTPKNCSQVGHPIKCVKIDPKYCIKGCLCKEGYLREDDGTCVPEKKCRKVCKKNEEYSECINGGCTPKNCSQVGLPIKCVKIDPKYCIKGCLCIEGYLREDDGTCVPEKKCKKKCTKPNEYYDPCGYDCPSQSCKSINKKQHCPIETSDNCKPLCKCEEGFYRNLIGECIAKKHCLQCPGAHEYWSCGGACDNVCKDMHKQNQTNCPIVNKKCNEKCYCEKNYARAKNDTCIPIKKCNEHQCGKNERYEKCPARLTEPQKCSELVYPLPDPPCSDDDNCPVKPTCVCISGYVRNDKGVCIPKKDCHVCTKPNEYLELCDNGCPPNTCKSLDMAYVCPIREGDKCAPRCKCKPGFFRNKNGECITEEQCRKCMDPHEYWSCGGACDNVCKDMHKQNQTNCPIVNIQCNEMCYCEKTYARANNGTCIPIEKCNAEACTGANEVYEDCTNPSCRPTKCCEVGFPLNCTEPPACEKGCTCKDGYVRNKKGICVTLKQCGTCGGDKNAEPGSGVNCLKKCYDLQYPDKPKPCPKIYKVNACDCKKGFYLDEEKNKCVRDEDCPYCCPEDEVHDSCVNGGCGHRNCSELGGPILCIDPIECYGGCTCKEGYLRLDSTGQCVPEDQCPESCTKPNEVYVQCPPKCEQTCESLNQTFDCPLIETEINESDCIGECRCKENFYRNLNGECICKEDCLKCTGAHVYFSCGPACDNVCSDLDTKSKDNCPIKNVKCEERCYCEDGYARDKDDVCICISDCPDRTSTTPKPVVNSTLALEKFEQGNVEKSIEFLKLLYDTRPGENFMISLLSILTVLAQITLPAVGDALKQLLGFGNLSNKDEIRTIFPILMDKLNNQEHVKLVIANKIYGNIIYPFTDTFMEDASLFESEVENVDFSESVKVAKDINDWVNDKTEGLIDNIVNEDMFSAQTRLAIFNCIYFLGNWVKQFNPDNTHPRDFYINGKDTVSIPTMYQEDRFKCLDSNDLDAECVLLPYKGGENSLLICIPKEIEGLKALLDKFEPDTLDKIMDSLEEEKLKIYIPRFEFPTNLSNLKEFLVKLGLGVIFEESNDFNGILENGEKLMVTDMIQKSQINVDETGTEAAVTTGLIFGTTAVQLVRSFEWNRPGLFFLLSNGHLLLSGIYSGAQE